MGGILVKLGGTGLGVTEETPGCEGDTGRHWAGGYWGYWETLGWGLLGKVGGTGLGVWGMLGFTGDTGRFWRNTGETGQPWAAGLYGGGGGGEWLQGVLGAVEVHWGYWEHQ